VVPREAQGLAEGSRAHHQAIEAQPRQGCKKPLIARPTVCHPTGRDAEAKDWCRTHYPGSPITEIGADAARRKVTRDNPTAKMVLPPDAPFSRRPR
jgi:hypothetical protein